MMGKGFLAKRTGVWLALLASVAGVSGNLVAAEIRDVRVASTDTGTRVVLDLSGPAKHKAFQLDTPNRVVLDLSKSSWRPQVGERVRVIPNHVCIVVHLNDVVYGIRGDVLETSWPVAARGRGEPAF